MRPQVPDWGTWGRRGTPGEKAPRARDFIPAGNSRAVATQAHFRSLFSRRPLHRSSIATMDSKALLDWYEDLAARARKVPQYPSEGRETTYMAETGPTGAWLAEAHSALQALSHPGTQSSRARMPSSNGRRVWKARIGCRTGTRTSISRSAYSTGRSQCFARGAFPLASRASKPKLSTRSLSSPLL